MLELINEFNQVIQNQHTKLLAFQYTNNEQPEKEITKTIQFTITSKRIKY